MTENAQMVVAVVVVAVGTPLGLICLWDKPWRRDSSQRRWLRERRSR